MSLTKVTYSMISGSPVNVLDYGATGNGSDDDTTAIQAALDYAETQGGGTVILPAGSYLISADLVVGNGCSVKGYGESTTIYLQDGVNAFLLNNKQNISFDNFWVRGKNSSAGNAFNITGSGISNLYISNLNIRNVNSAIQTIGSSIITHMHVDQCQFSYNNNWHIDIANGTEVNSVWYTNTRFEQNNDGFGAYKAIGSSIATGSTQFTNCVFEGMVSYAAVDVGSNCYCFFEKCHFEDNGVTRGGTTLANPTDITIGIGDGVVSVKNCTFSYPDVTAIDFYNIRKGNSALQLTVENCSVIGYRDAYVSNYSGFIYTTYTSAVTVKNNFFAPSGTSTTFDYLTGVSQPVDIFNSGNENKGFVRNSIVKKIQTTDATPTIMFGSSYNSYKKASFIRFDVNVIGCNSSGHYGSYVLRRLYSVSDSYALTYIGNQDETPLESDVSLDATIVVTNSGTSAAGFELQVTGLAGVTIDWLAEINIICCAMGY